MQPSAGKTAISRVIGNTGNSRELRNFLVPENGVEPSRPCGHRILSPARLPVPPLGHDERISQKITGLFISNGICFSHKGSQSLCASCAGACRPSEVQSSRVILLPPSGRPLSPASAALLIATPGLSLVSSSSPLFSMITSRVFQSIFIANSQEILLASFRRIVQRSGFCVVGQF